MFYQFVGIKKGPAKGGKFLSMFTLATLNFKIRIFCNANEKLSQPSFASVYETLK